MISVRRDIIGEPGKPVPRIRHFGGFVIGGVSALCVDIATTKALIAFAGFNPFLARLIAYVPALLTSWLINRTITFRMEVPPDLTEFAKFVGVVWLSQTVNYSIYAMILLARPATDPAVAIVAASLIAMFVSYTGYRFGVFRHPNG